MTVDAPPFCLRRSGWQLASFAQSKRPDVHLHISLLRQGFERPLTAGAGRGSSPLPATSSPLLLDRRSGAFPLNELSSLSNSKLRQRPNIPTTIKTSRPHIGQTKCKTCWTTTTDRGPAPTAFFRGSMTRRPWARVGEFRNAIPVATWSGRADATTITQLTTARQRATR